MLSLKFNSQMRYWLLLLVTLALNIVFIIYFVPSDENFCPQLFSFDNGTIGPDPDLPDEYVIANFILGSLYAILTVWMLVEYFTVTWPHFVLPEFLYSFKNYCKRHRLLSFLSKYELCII